MAVVELVQKLIRSAWFAISRWRSTLGKKSGNLPTEVSASLPVIELLESQIADAVRTANESTDNLSQTFGDMAGRARDVVERATETHRDESEGGVDQVRAIVSTLLTQVRNTNSSTEQTAGMLSTIEQDLQDVETCMREIEGIANRSRMVSLNGRIEAARVGVHGEGFAVVAAETGELAASVSETSHRIRQVVDRLTHTLRETSAQTMQLASDDQEATASHELQVEAMLTSLEQYQRELECNLESTKYSSDQLASAISQSIINLQFQDAVSQRMNHVTETMQEIRETFGSLVDPDSQAAKRRSKEWLEKLASSYCVDNERLVHNGSSQADFEQSNSSNIELF